jgi:hypothetical protein
MFGLEGHDTASDVDHVDTIEHLAVVFRNNASRGGGASEYLLVTQEYRRMEVHRRAERGAPEICAFEREARFYEARHGRKANRLLVISPMVDRHARKVADKLGIELYSDSEDFPAL